MNINVIFSYFFIYFYFFPTKTPFFFPCRHDETKSVRNSHHFQRDLKLCCQ
jgi:hypothetical protein